MTRPTIMSFRLGLCCQFVAEPIHFRTTTATFQLQRPPEQRRQMLSEIAMANAEALWSALQYCAQHGIGCFRINSQFLPLYTHPQIGYRLTDLIESDAIQALLSRCARFASEQNIRLVFHPDQFVVLNSNKEEVVENSIRDLEYHGELSELLGADVINIHGGAAYGDKRAALERLERSIDRLSSAVRSRLTIENDDRTYTPCDLLPLCRRVGLPLVYDVHHHRCLPDNLAIDQATAEAMATWNREPLFHLSSPLGGWDMPNPARHHDYISPEDFPACWKTLPITVEVEAKAKELAVLRLKQDLAPRSGGRRPKLSIPKVMT